MTEPLTGYWAFAAATAGGFYAWLSWFGRSHLSPAARDELALWLMGAHESGWARTFCRLFDSVFGARHLSWRCFLRSSLASVAAVAALYLLFGEVLGVLDDRALGELTLWQALLIGAAVNVVPDYVSLYETRWLLGRIERVTSVSGQIAVLAADAVITGAIIWGGVALFLALRGEAPPGPVEMMAVFSVYSVFFYSTFLTSAWAWVHCLSRWVMRLFSRTPLVRVLDVERNPAAQLGLVGGVVIFAGAVAVAPLLASGEDDRVTALDRASATSSAAGCACTLPG